MSRKKRKPKYSVQTWHEVREEDFPLLPDELIKRYDSELKLLLAADPHTLLKRVGNHFLKGSLFGYLAAEIEWDSDTNEYRLIYRIDEKKKFVVVVSFRQHKTAYLRATSRVSDRK